MSLSLNCAKIGRYCGPGGRLFAFGALGFSLVTSISGQSTGPSTPLLIRLARPAPAGPVLYFGSETVTLQQFKDNNGTLTRPTARLTLNNDGRINVTAQDRVGVVVEDLVGWKMHLTPATEVSIAVSTDRNRIEATTPTQDHPVMIELPDGGTAIAQGGSTVDFDSFRDRTYTVQGVGQVSAKNAEGKDVSLGAGLPPMTGGPLINVVTPQGENRLKRLTPTIALVLASFPDGQVQLRAGSQTWRLSLGLHQDLTFTNGSILRVCQNSAQSVTWEVIRGDYLIQIAGLAGWRVHGWTDQKAVLTWSVESQAVDLENLSASPLIAALPNRADAWVGPNAILQFVRLSDVTSAVSSLGGDVSLHDPANGQRMPLGRAAAVLKTGVRFEPSPKQAPSSIGLGWRGDGELAVIHGGMTKVLRSGQEESFAGATGGELQVRLARNGTVEISAYGGDYVIAPEKLSEFSIFVPENASVSLLTTPTSGFVEAKAGLGNTSPVRLTGRDGTSMALDANMSVLILVPMLALADAGRGAVYSEALEATGPRKPVSSAPPVPVEGFFEREAIYRPRVVQPPVSVLGHN